MSCPKYLICFLNFSIFNSVDSGQWVQDPAAAFESDTGFLGHTIVGDGEILVAAGGRSGVYLRSIFLFSPDAVRGSRSAKLPSRVANPCATTINSTSKHEE